MGTEGNDEQPSDRRRPRGGRDEALWALGTSILAFLVAAWSLRLWQWAPADPFALGWDNTQIAMALKDIHDHGWYWRNDDLGFPSGQNNSWFPELNVLHIVLIKIIDLVVAGGPFTAGSLYFVLCFPLTGVTGYLLARSQGLGRPAGVALGVLLANAPGHAERFGHLYLAAYWVAPVALWLVLEVAQGRALLSSASLGRSRWWRGRTLVTVGAVVVVGWSGVYYVAFTLVLLVVVAVARRVAGTPADLLRGLAVSAAIGSLIAVPLLAARLAIRGELVTGRVPATRAPAETEIFSGKLMDLVLPWPHHRVDVLQLLSFVYNGTTRATVEVSALGIVAVGGLVALTVVGLLALLTGRSVSARLRTWAGVALVTFLFYTVGGLASFVAFVLTPQVRTWSRIFLYLMVLCLLAVGYWLTRLERRRGVLVAGVAAGALVIIGSLDQTNPERAPDHAAVSAEMDGLRSYTRALEDAVGTGCAVFQVPVLPYPETLGPVRMEGYDQLKPYLTSSGLRFSFGAMRGTAAGDWMLAVETQDVRSLAADLRAVGFCALEVDTQGFTPEQDPTPRLRSVLGPPVASTPEGTFVAYDLRGAGAPGEGDATRSARTLEPVLVTVDAYAHEEVDARLVQYLGPFAGISFSNLGREPVEVTVSLQVEGVGDEPRRVSVKDGTTVVAQGEVRPGEPTPLTLRHRATRGLSTLSVEISGPRDKVPGDDRVLAALLRDVTVQAPPGVRAVAHLDQVATGWVAP